MKSKSCIRVLLILLVTSSITGCVQVTATTAQPTATPPATVEPPVTVAPAWTGKGTWQVVLELASEQPLRIAAFHDASFGLTGGPSEAGKARYTTDGGATWTMAESSADCLFGLDIVDAQTAWQCSLGPVRVSTDGGQTWQAVTDLGNCRQMSFLDAQTGWIATFEQLGQTSDGGQTWEPVPLPAEADYIAAISLRTPTDGTLLDVAGVLFITQDGGQNWSSHPLPLDLGEDTLPNHDTASAAVRFVDANHGVAIVHLDDELDGQVVAFRTTDGGQTWAREVVMNGAPFLLSMHLSHDGATLTITDKVENQITVLRYTEPQ